MKQGDMTWSEGGAKEMLQIRSSIASGRHLQDFIAALDLGMNYLLSESAPCNRI